MKLGGGRETKDDDIDPNVGVVLNKKVGDFVKKGDLLCELYCNKALTTDITPMLDDAYELVNEVVKKPDTILEIISK